MQIKPTSQLSGIVRHFLVIESDRHAAMRIFSDGNTGIVINYGDALSYQAEKHLSPALLPNSFLYGQLDTFRNVWASGKIRLLIAVLYPFGATALLRIPAVELRNQILGCEHFFGQDADIFTERIAPSASVAEKIRVMESILISGLQERPAGSSLVMDAVRLIQVKNGMLPVASLAEITGITERQLQRKFEEHVGISPKRFAGITRMQYALKMLRRKSSDISLAGIACESGFFDQAHLIREMKNLSGLTPGQYFTPQSLLAANLIRIT